jgi:hypothetical protein
MADGTERFAVHPNTQRLHKGCRENGAECGTQSSSGWAEIEATNPLNAVVVYAVRPCTRCFNRSLTLSRIYKKLHTSLLIEKSTEEIAATLPWELHTDGDEQ